jgi:hypothetical protein
MIKLNEWNAAFYDKETKDGNMIYYWITGSKNDLLICSFSFGKPFPGTNWHNDELIVINEILKSIKILN